MKGLQFSSLAEADAKPGYLGSTCEADGGATSSVVDFSELGLWLVRAELAPGASLTWSAVHGDEALYVESGELSMDTRSCSQGGVVVVEAGAGATAVAPDGARLIHFGPVDPKPPADGYYGPPAAGPRGVHVIGRQGIFASVGEWRDTRLFVDATCKTCRISLALVSREDEYVSTQHSHSVDEVIYVLRGELRFGNYRAGPGDAVGIAAGRRYAFRSGRDGFSFLNYRRDASEQTIVGQIPQLEGGLARGLMPIQALD